MSLVLVLLARHLHLVLCRDMNLFANLRFVRFNTSLTQRHVRCAATGGGGGGSVGNGCVSGCGSAGLRW